MTARDRQELWLSGTAERRRLVLVARGAEREVSATARGRQGGRRPPAAAEEEEDEDVDTPAPTCRVGETDFRPSSLSKDMEKEEEWDRLLS